MVSGISHLIKITDRSFVKHLFLLSFVTFIIVLPIFCWRSPSSWYSWLSSRDKEKEQEQMRQENNIRLTEARHYMNQVFSNFWGKEKAHLPPFYSANHMSQNASSETSDVGITIITVSRNHQHFDNYQPFYLTQTVSYFLRLLNNTHGLHVTFKLFLCDVDRDPSSYPELLNLSKIVPTFQRFPYKGNRLYIDLGISEKLEKEKQDYVYCAQQTMNQNVSYVFLVEDDALPHSDLLHVADNVITKYINASRFQDSTLSNQIAYVKFYHPNRLLGYISLEVERLPELFGLGLMLTSFLVFVYSRIRNPLAMSYKSVWVGFLLYSLLLFLVLGRDNVIEFRRLSRQLYQITPAPSCCTPAILYPKRGMEGVIKYLKNVRCMKKFGKDMALDQYLEKTKLKAKLVQPNLFTHIGMYSSLRNDILDPKIV